MRHARAIVAVLLAAAAWAGCGGAIGRFCRSHSEEPTFRRVLMLSAFNPRRKVASYWSFEPLERLAPERGIGVNTVLAKGAHGSGLRFDGDDDTFFATEFCWEPKGSFSVSFWMKEERLPARQDIVFQGQRPIGVRMDSGSLCFDVTTDSGVQSVSFPFLNFGKFTHVVAVADVDAGRISLYENGVLRAERAVGRFAPVKWIPMFGRCSPLGKRYPFAGTLDEVVLWDKAITPREAARLASSPSATRRMALSPSRRLRIARHGLLFRVGRAARCLARMPSPNIVRQVRAFRARRALKRLDLTVDRGAMRRLLKAQVRSRASGHRTRAASRPREAFVSFGGNTAPCRISLAGGTLCHPFAERPAFVLAPATGDEALPGGARRILLAPPEASGWLSRVADSVAWRLIGLPSPPPSAELVSLRVNGRDAGCYIACDAAHMFVQLGEEDDPLRYDDIRQLQTQRRLELERFAPADLSGRVAAAICGRLDADSRAAFVGALRDAADALWGDFLSPVPQRERDSLLRENLDVLLRVRGEPDAGGFLLDEPLLLGRNPAPWFVECDLDFSGARAPDGWGVFIKSESPEWIDDRGHLLKRPKSAPEFVSLAAEITDPQGRKSRRALKFRLVPEDGKVPALFAWTPIPLDKSHRTDAAVEVLDPARRGDGRFAYFTATGSGGPGGIRFRGNNSFRTNMKLPSIKLDAPHRFFGDSQTRLLLAINSCTDPLRVMNGLAYDTFRSFPGTAPQVNFAPHVKVFEVFLNGRYRGLLEFAEAIDRHMLGEEDAAVFRHMTTYPRQTFVRQSRPAAAEIDAMPAYDALIADLEAPATTGTRSSVVSMLDMGNVVDLQILFSFFANANGGNYHFWTHDAIAWIPSRSQFLFIPWDFDVAHGRGSPLWGVIRTDLDRWLEREIPGHRERVRRRWRELRRTVLTAENIADALERRLSIHFEYLPSDSLRWNDQPLSRDDFARLRDEELEFLLEQLGRLDRDYAE